MNESPGLPTLSLTCFVLGVLDVQLFKWYQNGNIAQEVDVLSTALKASALVATHLVLIFIDVSCTKTLTDELTAIGEKHYQREDRVLLDLALVLVWRRCLCVR